MNFIPWWILRAEHTENPNLCLQRVNKCFGGTQQLILSTTILWYWTGNSVHLYTQYRIFILSRNSVQFSHTEQSLSTISAQHISHSVLSKETLLRWFFGDILLWISCKAYSCIRWVVYYLIKEYSFEGQKDILWALFEDVIVAGVLCTILCGPAFTRSSHVCHDLCHKISNPKVPLEKILQWQRADFWRLYIEDACQAWD